MMKKFKYLLLVFVAFLTLNMNAKAATLPELFITNKSDYVEVGKKLSEYDLKEGVLSLPVGNTLQLIAFTAHGNDIHTEDLETGWFVDEVNLQGVTWSSKNTSVATVDSNGLVKTIKEGTATIVASYNGKTKNFEINVTSTKECAICAGCGSYNIIFITNGGNEISTMSICKTCADSTQRVSLPTPTKKGYQFIGWYKDAELENPVDISLPSRVGDYVDDGCYDSETAIYAKWKDENECPVCVGCGGYKINFETNGGKAISALSICKTCSDSANKVNLPIPEKKGFNFAGWYSDANFTKKVENDVPSKIGDYKDKGCYDSETTIYAKWIDETINIEENTSSDNPIITNDEPTNIEENTSSDEPTIEPEINPTKTDNNSDEKKNSNNLVIIIIIAAVAVLAAIGSIILVKSKKNSKEN